ncbi:MAG: hypothetical protein UIH27_07115 [Ruminococcus sp.]|nr:hypothetical protein [Ruminococcus sp.]
MTDIRLENGDAVRNGAPMLTDSEARVQRVLVRTGVRQGSFIYNRALGSEYTEDLSDAQAQAVLNEALADCENTRVTLLSRDEGLLLGIVTEDGYCEREVRFYG